jgi:hypothetical protein
MSKPFIASSEHAKAALFESADIGVQISKDMISDFKSAITQNCQSISVVSFPIIR